MTDDMQIFGDHDEKTLGQARQVAEQAEYFVLCADGHLGYWMPVGGVAAFKDKIPPAGVGYDIACGNLAARTDLNWWGDELDGKRELWDQIWDELSFGVGGYNGAHDAPVDHPVFDDGAWEIIPEDLREPLREKARNQLGTIGSGNHYVDIFTDDQECVWVGVHFGSRGLGHTIASWFMAVSAGKDIGDRVPESESGMLDTNQPSGQDYIDLMRLAGAYAYAGRKWVVEKVCSVLEGQFLQFSVHNNHNFAWSESIDGEDLWVVRKGATPAYPGQRGFVGGSMGDKSVILAGSVADDAFDDQRRALFSTVHGAGRVMSRSRAKGKWKKGECVRPGLVSPEMMQKSIEDANVLVYGSGLDEAPQVYRPLDDVIVAHGSTIDVQVELKPRVVFMAAGSR